MPVNIAHRADEIENLNEKINAILNEFIELKTADEDFEGNKESELKIKDYIG